MLNRHLGHEEKSGGEMRRSASQSDRNSTSTQRAECIGGLEKHSGSKEGQCIVVHWNKGLGGQTDLGDDGQGAVHSLNEGFGDDEPCATTEQCRTAEDGDQKAVYSVGALPGRGLPGRAGGGRQPTRTEASARQSLGMAAPR